ncbi:MAG TPA: hypothetical protein PLO44_02950 [Candidatus Paceibacterota bacterium]|nr:hypothetical protein [Candidatus Paceibacterota bacterium]
MKKLIKKNWFTILAIILLLLAVLGMLAGYFEFLRWVVSCVALYNAYLATKTKNTSCALAMLAVVIVFNPVYPFDFGKTVWAVLELVAAVVLFISIKKIRK